MYWAIGIASKPALLLKCILLCENLLMDLLYTSRWLESPFQNSLPDESVEIILLQITVYYP